MKGLVQYRYEGTVGIPRGQSVEALPRYISLGEVKHEENSTD